MCPTLLLEPSRTNFVKYSEAFDQWSVSTSITRSSGQADPKGGTAAWNLADGSTGQQGGVSSTAMTLTASTFAVLSVFFRQGSSASTAGSDALLRVYSTGTIVARCRAVFSSGVPTVTYVTGSSIAKPEQYRDGWWRAQVRTSGAVSTSTPYMVSLIPAVVTGEVGDIYAFGAQVEL